MAKKTILLKNCLIIDGSGLEEGMFTGDVQIEGDRISRIGSIEGGADEIIDCDGLCLAPGFIDIHAHTDYEAFFYPQAEHHLRQGVTTTVCGNCGFSAFPSSHIAAEVMVAGLAFSIPRQRWQNTTEYFAACKQCAPATNLAALVGAGVLRAQVMGFADRPPSEQELHAMQELLRQSLRAGAWGVSSGLSYVPGNSTAIDELIALAQVAAEDNALYATHMRGRQGKNALAEALEVARKTRVNLEISHYKNNDLEETQRMLVNAREEGLNVHYDIYPYLAAAKSAIGVFPRKFTEDGPTGLRRALADPLLHNELAQAGGSMGRFFIGSCLVTREYVGLTMKEVAERRRESVGETLICLLQENNLGLQLFGRGNDDEMVEECMITNPLAMIGSDGIFLRAVEEKPDMNHPRSHGAFARILGRYVRDRGILSLEQAVYKMSGMPAAKLGLVDRGLIKKGFYADIVVFDKTMITDKATYDAPNQYAVGVEHVFVNGRLVIRSGKLTGDRPGQVLKKQ